MNPCQCWTQPARYHPDHCCMAEAGATCHDREGKALHAGMDPGDPR